MELRSSSTPFAQAVQKHCRRSHGAVCGSAKLPATLPSVVGAVASAAIEIADTLRHSWRRESFGSVGRENIHGEDVQQMDVAAHQFLVAALSSCPHALAASEEHDQPIAFDQPPDACGYVIGFDPLDGSSNLNTANPVGTIFSVFEAPAGWKADPLAAILQRGSRQLAAGYVLFSSSTELVLAAGGTVDIFSLDLTGRDLTPFRSLPANIPLDRTTPPLSALSALSAVPRSAHWA